MKSHTVVQALLVTPVLTAVAWVSALAAQGDPGTMLPPYTVPRSEVRRLHSDSVGVDYLLYVSLPRSFSGGLSRYPLIVTLDADYAFPLAHAVVEHFVDRGDLPEMIVVSIAYEGARDDLDLYRRDRTRDYTPTATLEGGYGPAFQRFSGGGPRFRAFIAHELLPFLDNTYRLTPGDRTFVGHSYGGLFGTYVLLTCPELFSRYVLVSPSLWYDDRVVFDLERVYAARHDSLPARVFLAVGERENSRMADDLATLERRLRAREYRGLVLGRRVFTEERHNGVFPAALTRGLRFVFGRDRP